MTNEQKLMLMKERAFKMEMNGKNIKCGGALRALKREIKNLESKIG